MSALGLTCREAFTVFSQNETLRLQKEVLRLETELATSVCDYTSLKARFIRKNRSDGYVDQGCSYGMCAFCECETNDCRCDWVCQCKECEDDRLLLKRKGWTDDEMRTIRRMLLLHTP